MQSTSKNLATDPTVESVVVPRSGAAEYPLLDPAFPKDPYPLLHRMRSEQPVTWFAPLNTWMLTRYEDVSNVLRDPGRFSSRRADRMLAGQLPENTPAELRGGIAYVMSMAAMFADPPQHTFLRSEANKGFGQRAMAAVVPRIHALTNELLDKVQARGSMDGFREFLQPFAITIICDVMGVPREDVQLFLDWTFKTTLLLGGSKLSVEQAQDSMRAFEEMNAHLVKLLEQRIREPREDMMSLLVAGTDLTKFPIEAVAGLCAELVGGANAPTGDALGNALLACLANPEQVARAQQDPSLWPNAVQELLRYDGPVVFWTRLLTQDVEIGGKQLRAGDMVYVSLGAANRDPAMFPDPDRLDFSRTNVNKHLAFSLGPHFCVGAGLARIEMAILFETLFRRMPRLRLAGPISWREGTLSTRGPLTIPLEF